MGSVYLLYKAALTGKTPPTSIKGQNSLIRSRLFIWMDSVSLTLKSKLDQTYLSPGMSSILVRPVQFMSRS